MFFPPEENKLFKDSIHGSFGGIGAEIDKKDGILIVVAPLKGTPAEKSGILSGDKILRINKEDATNITIDKAISLIRGQIGTNVELTILREGEKKTRDFNIIRENIDIPTIKTEKKGDVFVIKLNSSGNSLVFSTYLVGSGDDEGLGIAVDASEYALCSRIPHSNASICSLAMIANGAACIKA